MPPAFGLMTGKLQSNFRCFLFFAFAMDRLRYYPATSQACNYGTLSSGIIATQKTIARHQCYGARAWDQTRERARRSKHHWGYDLHLPLPCSILNTRTASVWSHPSSSLLLRWPRQLEILVRGRRERSERGGRSHIILNLCRRWPSRSYLSILWVLRSKVTRVRSAPICTKCRLEGLTLIFHSERYGEDSPSPSVRPLLVPRQSAEIF